MSNASTHTNSEGRASEQLREKTQILREDVAEIARVAKEAAQEKVIELQESAQDQAKQVEMYVKNEPLKSILIASGVGFVLGFLFRR